jgi:hypothetical protein
MHKNGLLRGPPRGTACDVLTCSQAAPRTACDGRPEELRAMRRGGGRPDELRAMRRARGTVCDARGQGPPQGTTCDWQGRGWLWGNACETLGPCTSHERKFTEKINHTMHTGPAHRTNFREAVHTMRISLYIYIYIYIYNRVRKSL